MLTALLALSLASAPTPKAEAPASPAQPPLVDFFRQPDRVQIFLADSGIDFFNRGEMDKAKKFPRAGSFLLIKEGGDLSAKERQRLAKTWVSPQEVTPEPPTMCIFNADIALRFWRGKEWVDAVVCLGCRDIVFTDARGEGIDGGDFRDYGVLRQLAARAFPQGGYRQD